MITIRVVTAAGTNASRIGDGYGSYDGVTWRNSVDACDADGSGRVFLQCDCQDTADFVADQLEQDTNVICYDLWKNK